MTKQALILGLGQFGLSLAKSLTAKGIEVMAVDVSEERVQKAATFAADAFAFDSTNEAALARAAPENRDFCVVAIGDQAREGSIVTTALLRQMGARFIVARANDDIHERILRLVGAHEVVNPERAFGERLASRLAYRGVIDQVPLGEHLMFSELALPAKLVGRTLADIALPRRFGVTVVGVRRVVQGKTRVEAPRPTEPLEAEDVLLVVAPRDALAGLSEGL